MIDQEGLIEVPGGRVWYESRGDGPPVIVLHGGPGADSEYVKPLMALSDDGYRVTRYDQLGSRRSDKPDDTTLWNVPRFVDELETVRNRLEINSMHLIGQSWGSFLALEYALHHQDRLTSLTLYSGAASTVQCFDGMNSLRAQLPAEMQETLVAFEADNDTVHPKYLAAINVLLRKHLCRLDPWPEELTSSVEHMALPVYNTMWGPNEFTLTGNLEDWERRDRLGEIDVPTLILCGRFDEVVPACSETMHRGIPGSQLTIFENSSHLAHFEEPDAFFARLRRFLAEVDTQGEAAARA